MKKITKANFHAHWEKNRLFLWLFIFVIFAFAFSLVWTRLMIFEALRQNLVESAGLKVANEPSSIIKITNRVAQEAEVFTLNAAQKGFDELSFLTSPNGQSIAYIFNDQKFNKKTVSLNSQAGASYDDITFMKFSPSGQRFAYGAKVNGKNLVVLDGQEGKLYDWIFEPHFFSPDNQYFIYKARTNRGDILVFNTWESRPYDRIYSVTINNSQTKLIFYARLDDQIWRGIVDLNKPLEANTDLQNISESVN